MTTASDIAVGVAYRHREARMLEFVGGCVAQYAEDLKHQRESYVVTRWACTWPEITRENKEEAIEILKGLRR